MTKCSCRMRQRLGNIVFHALEAKDCGNVLLYDFIKGASVLSDGTLQERLAFCFKLFHTKRNRTIPMHPVVLGKTEMAISPLPFWGPQSEEQSQWLLSVILVAGIVGRKQWPTCARRTNFPSNGISALLMLPLS